MNVRGVNIINNRYRVDQCGPVISKPDNFLPVVIAIIVVIGNKYLWRR